MGFPATLDLVWQGGSDEAPDGQSDAVYRDDLFQLVVTHEDGDGAAIDVSARTVLAQVRTSLRPQPGDVLATFEVDDTNADSGIVALSIPASVTAGMQPGAWFWDYQETGADPDGRVTILRGRCDVVGDVSQ